REASRGASRGRACGQKPLRGPIAGVVSGLRFYSPNLARWINRDPIGEEDVGSLYGFARNNANGWIDAAGLYVGPLTQVATQAEPITIHRISEAMSDW
ncbi:MAG: hypothetical protein JXR37_27635, partial [Kiritimatiellae bacterium]|nr:hypothetical protein [Kiritimatiellia bacterium]